MIYTVENLTCVQQNHSREILLIHASQNGICGTDVFFLLTEISYFHFVSQKDGYLFLNMPSIGSMQFFRTPLTILVITRSVCYYKVVRDLPPLKNRCYFCLFPSSRENATGKRGVDDVSDN